ncbi:hypothetical protein PPYR_05456 [Photinus pyralis]|uniref:Zinc finger PHD-type domain-containing protein n=1 Tax=Photinus pyralis TaxID=7054 RepID=A0A5N4AUQ0_PHOPY|nr:uncharacterized protein LOC116165280 [Photinus pyralis]KAB0801102.1 hypothetical protein PPYR_05456 [Photinus pyralis]
MGRYKRQSSRHSWDEGNMKQAIVAVREKKMGWLLASKTFNVPFTTLRRRAAKVEGWKKDYMGGHKVTFNEDLEREIVQHLRNLESRFFGLTAKDVRSLAYQIAETKKIPHRFSSSKKMAGWDWLRGFRQRNPTISLRTPESTSAARASAFNREQIKKYFKKLAEVLDTYKFEPNDIWNVDESGFSTVPSRNSKIFATKGRKQVGILTSAERGQHFTVACCMNVIGTFVPPAIIFPRKNMKYELMDGAPTGSVGFAQENGWMNGEVFLKWMKHFIKFAKPTAEKKVLLLLDGHSSHKNLDVLLLAKESGVVMFCFPPHCTHRVQPLDVSFYGPLTTFYNQELNNWLRNHPGRTVTHFQVTNIFNEAYVKAATAKNAQNGYSATGIFPYNPDIFPDHMFAPAEVTNVPEREEHSINVTDDGDQSGSGEVGAGTSHEELPTDIDKDIMNISVEDILPLPVTTQTTRKVNKRRGKYGFLNSTPEIKAVKDLVAEKAAEALRKSAKAAKRRVLVEGDVQNKNEIPDKPLRRSGRAVQKHIVVGNEDTEESSEEDPFAGEDAENDVSCIYCNDLYSRSRSNELWVQCQECRQWCHAECAGAEKKFKTFICDICKA